MKKDCQEALEEEFAAILCSFDRLETLTKVLKQTLTENYDFEKKDSHNLCSVLLEEIRFTKEKLNRFESYILGTDNACR